MNLQKIAIEGMEFYAYHGFYQEENIIGGYYQVDVYVQTDFSTAAEEDELTGTVNYVSIFEICQAVMQVPVQLIEHVAHKIGQSIQEKHPTIIWLKVRVSKMTPPISGKVGRTYVEIEKNFT